MPNQVTVTHEDIFYSSAIQSLPVYSSDAAGRRLPDYCEEIHCQNGGTPAVTNEVAAETEMKCEVS